MGMPFGNLNAMKNTLTLDKAGRMVLPQHVRTQFDLRTGSELELKLGSDAIMLYPVTRKPSLTKENGLYVHEGLPEGAMQDAIGEARSERDQRVWRGVR